MNIFFKLCHSKFMIFQEKNGILGVFICKSYFIYTLFKVKSYFIWRNIILYLEIWQWQRWLINLIFLCMYTGLFDGWYDGCAGWYTTVERIHVFAFSQPYLKTPNAYFFVKKDDSSFDPSDITGLKIGHWLDYQKKLMCRKIVWCLMVFKFKTACVSVCIQCVLPL